MGTSKYFSKKEIQANMIQKHTEQELEGDYQYDLLNQQLDQKMVETHALGSVDGIVMLNMNLEETPYHMVEDEANHSYDHDGEKESRTNNPFYDENKVHEPGMATSDVDYLIKDLDELADEEEGLTKLI